MLLQHISKNAQKVFIILSFLKDKRRQLQMFNPLPDDKF